MTDFDKELRTLVKDLTETMLEAPGVGPRRARRSASSLRVFTYHVDEDELGHLVNPTLDLSDEEQDGEEGCLSVPGPGLRVHAGDARGRQGLRHARRAGRRSRARDLLARCVQHETDHLDGILFVDRLDQETRKAAMKAIREAEWFGETVQVKVSPHPTYGTTL